MLSITPGGRYYYSHFMEEEIAVRELTKCPGLSQLESASAQGLITTLHYFLLKAPNDGFGV